MILKLLGGIFIVIACGGCGFMLAASHRHELRCLEALILAIDQISCELQYRLTSLPDLCQQASAATSGTVSEFFIRLQRELNKKISPNASDCAEYVLKEMTSIPAHTRDLLLQLGASLGQFDVEGQLTSLATVKLETEGRKAMLSDNMDVRLRSYQTLGLCAGAALAILFI